MASELSNLAKAYAIFTERARQLRLLAEKAGEMELTEAAGITEHQADSHEGIAEVAQRLIDRGWTRGEAPGL